MNANMLKSIYKFLSPKYDTLFSEYPLDLKPRFNNGQGSHSELNAIINRQRSIYSEYLHRILEDKEVFFNIPFQADPKAENEPYYNNKFFPGLDLLALYSMIKNFSPKNIVEIGSGNSTLIARKAVREKKLNTVITSVDPEPRACIERVADVIIKKPVESLDSYRFIFDLQENDILFIDNSHRCLPNSDVTVVFLEILPFIRKGVIVHIHDIYLPYDYPQIMCDRFYSEQYLLATLFLYSPDSFRILLPNYFISRDDELKGISNPVWSHPNMRKVETHGGSFWMQKM